jgi:tetraacyldisaccharide 4'-kinase
MREPAFWQRDGILPALLAPFGFVYAAATARRVARDGWHAPVPVLCAGNATAGGAGKTTLALDLGARLAARGIPFAFLTRGYGRRGSAVLRVDPAAHDAVAVGDEALLLAEIGKTYVAADRAAGARAAIAEGAHAVVMDDGLQNPTLAKTCSFLVIDGEAGFGNGRCIPAGPLREKPAAAAARCRAAVLIGPDRTAALASLPAGFPVLRAHLAPGAGLAALAGRNVVAFAGIGRPEKFFGMLEAAGVALAARRPFADHHRYTDAEFAGLLADAARARAILATTPKDAARLSAAQLPQVTTVGVRLVWDDDAIDALIGDVLAGSG